MAILKTLIIKPTAL